MPSAPTRIEPFHLFAHRGGWYLIRVEAMTASPLDRQTASILEHLQCNPDLPLGPRHAETLGRLDLIANGHEAPGEYKAPRPVPIANIVLFVTQICNLRCVYCYEENGGYGFLGSILPQTALRAVDWLIEQSKTVKDLSISFFGGEPLISFSLIRKVVTYALKRGKEAGKTFVFSITTNASLIDDQTIEFLKEHAIQTIVSFDGPRWIQDAQRPFAGGKGSYEAIVPKIRKLLCTLPDTRCRATLMRGTDPRKVKEALQEIGFQGVILAPASPSLFQHNTAGIGAPRQVEGLLKLLEEESEQWLVHTKNREVESLKSLGEGGIPSSAVAAFVNGVRWYYPCGAGRETVGVGCSGDVFPCHRFVGENAYKLGTVFDQELGREAYLQSPAQCVEACMNCFAKYHCAGGCKHDNAAMGGSAFSPAGDLCRIARRRVELAAWLSCQFDESDKAFLVSQELIPRKPCLLDFL